jgi:phosphohistidine phosphatase SixA
MTCKEEIFLVRSAVSPHTEPGSTGESMRPLEIEGHIEKDLLGRHIERIVGSPIAEVRFAPANRTRETALGVIGLTYSSIALLRDEQLTITDPQLLRDYLESLRVFPLVAFTHLDVIETAIAISRCDTSIEHPIPTASVTKLVRNDDGLEVAYIGMTPLAWKEAHDER